jgi:ABC-type Fe3+ transport system permease subunit
MTNQTSTMAPPGSCQQLLYAVQLFTGGTLLYVQYRMERDSGKAFLQGKVQLQDGWPRVPTFVRVVLHAVVLLQLFAVTWTLLLGGLNSNTSKHVL